MATAGLARAALHAGRIDVALAAARRQADRGPIASAEDVPTIATIERIADFVADLPAPEDVEPDDRVMIAYWAAAAGRDELAVEWFRAALANRSVADDVRTGPRLRAVASALRAAAGAADAATARGLREQALAWLRQG